MKRSIKQGVLRVGMTLEISLIQYGVIHHCDTKQKYETGITYNRSKDRFTVSKINKNEVVKIPQYICDCRKYEIWAANVGKCSYVGDVYPGELYYIKDVDSMLFKDKSSYMYYFENMGMDNNGFYSGSFIEQMYQYMIFQYEYNLRNCDVDEMNRFKLLLEKAKEVENAIIVHS